MKQYTDTIREIVSYLRQYKGRTLMTMFGIIWGTISLVVLLAFGLGLREAMSKNMHGMGEGIVIVFNGRTGMSFEGFNRGRPIRLTGEDADLLKRELPNIDTITGEYSRWNTSIRVKDKTDHIRLAGINVDFGDMRYMRPQPGGRWLNPLDIEHRRRVIFLGNDLKDFLFGKDTPAIGKRVYVAGSPFLVVGVLMNKVQNSSYGSRDKDSAFIPAPTFQGMFAHRHVNNIVYKMKNPSLAENTRNQVYEVLGNKYKFDPEDKQALHIWDTSEMDQFISYFSLGFNLFMGLIGVMTLTVGGIGLANIMYVVVQERTHEIGIRRAIGAHRHHIMSQFVLESLIIISVATIIGFFLSYLLIQLLSMLPYQDIVGTPEMSWKIAILSILILGLVGLTAGFFPARKAATMNVVDSLR